MGYDFSVPNAVPGECEKCRGTGLYQWGACVNGKMTHSGPCWSCRGTGKQSKADIKRNHGYNWHKLRNMSLD